ncbi:MAG TPA: methyltransferase domain-containing protein, partial [Candidatus Limnocylindrales bacterium]
MCRSTTAAASVQLREMMFGTRESFGYTICGSCGTIGIDDVPTDLGRHYPARYHYERLPEDMLPGGALHRALVGLAVRPHFSGTGHLAARVARRLVVPPAGFRRWRGSFQRWGVRSLRGGVLDVGCGPIPNRLIALRALGFTNLLGVDPFIEHDVVVEGVAVRKQRIEDIDGRFDVVWFHHSLEHVVDPA